MANDININESAILEMLNDKIDYDGGNYKGSGLANYVVDKSGDTMTGNLSFKKSINSYPTLVGYLSECTLGDLPETTQQGMRMITYDTASAGQWVATVQQLVEASDGRSRVYLAARNTADKTTYKSHTLDLVCKPDGSGGLYIDGKFLKAHVIETYRSGASWYRIWSDGWIEQGGKGTGVATISLLKAFSDTNYTLQVTRLAQSENVPFARSIAKNSFVVGWKIINQVLDSNGVAFSWYACGY